MQSVNDVVAPRNVVEMVEPIPKRIIQTAKHRNLSLKQRAMRANLTLLNPDYESVFFDNADVDRFICREFPQYKTTFDAFRFSIQRYDFFRYLAVYRLGGFYFDLDILLASDLSSLLPCGCVFPFEGLTYSRFLRSYGMDWEIGNYAFGAAAGHPFVEAVVENCVRAQRDRAWVEPMLRSAPLFSREEYSVLYTTGPGLLSRTFIENQDLARMVTVLFPEDVCDAGTWNVFGTLGVHLMEGTWRPSSSYVRRRFAQRWEQWTMRSRIKQSQKLGKTRGLASPAPDTTE